MINTKLILSAAVLSAGLFSFNGQALAGDTELIQKLVDQVEALSLRVKELEQANQVQQSSNDVLVKHSIESAVDTAKQSLLTDKIKFKGDFRLRHETIDDVTKAETRDRSRIRARIQANAKVNDNWSVGIGLASGGDDPVSTNQTLGNGGSTKGINLDLAYFDWSGLDNTHVLGGKINNPFYKPAKHALIWDGDYRPEGLAYKYENDSLFANAGFMYLESDNKAGSQDDKSFWGVQFGYKHNFGNAKVTSGVSYYHLGVAGSAPFFDNDSFGNSLLNDVYQYDYQELELFGELSFSALGQPVSVFIDWVQNQDADANDTAYAIGATIGNAKKPGTWKATYIYQDIEADAVFGLTTDSDFGGGGTNSKGHLIKADYAISKNTSFGVTYFSNERGSDATDYDRLQLDLKLKF